eukprot:m.39743 g.39743  ORF g.39743 m.39743 type:complete len:1080 (+) comp32802_c0_seq4:54-3293(+)
MADQLVESPSKQRLQFSPTVRQAVSDNTDGENVRNLFLAAVDQCDAKGIVSCIRKGVDVTQLVDGQTVLHRLIDSQVCPNPAEGDEAFSSLILQCVFHLLTSGVDVDAGAESAFRLSIRRGYPTRVVQKLLEASKRVDKVDSKRKTALYSLMASPCLSIELVDQFLFAGASLDPQLLEPSADNVKAPVVALAGSKVGPEAVISVLKHLMSSGEHKAVIICKRFSMLSAALRFGSFEAAEYLLQCVQEYDKENLQTELDQLERPLIVSAAMSVQRDYSDAPLKKLSLLFQHNLADCGPVFLESRNLCHFAVSSFREDILKLAIDKEVDMNKADEQGKTPLHLASEKEELVNLTRLLLLSEAELDCKDKDGNSPLYYSLSNENAQQVITLVEAGVNVRRSCLRHVSPRKLKWLVEPEVLMSSPNPLKFALDLSHVCHQAATVKPSTQATFVEMAEKLENAAVSIVDVMPREAANYFVDKELIEQAVADGHTKFVATKRVQKNLTKIWVPCDLYEGTNRDRAAGAALSVFLITVAPIILLLISPFFVIKSLRDRFFNVWQKLRIASYTTSAAPVVLFVANAVMYFVFIMLLVVYVMPVERPADGLLLLDWVLLVFIVALIANEIQQFKYEQTRFYLTKWTNLIDILMLVIFILHFSARIAGFSKSLSLDEVQSEDLLKVSSYSMATASILAILRFLPYLKPTPLGPILKSFSSITKQTLLFLCVLLFFLLAFAVGIANVYTGSAYEAVAAGRQNETLTCIPEEFRGAWTSAVSLFWMLFNFDLSITDSPELCNGFQPTAARIIIALWLIVAVIILTNMLIALISNEFQRVQDNSHAEFLHSRAETILEAVSAPVIPVPFNLLHYVVALLERYVLHRGKVKLSGKKRRIEWTMSRIAPSPKEAKDKLVLAYRKSVISRELERPAIKRDIRMHEKRMRSTMKNNDGIEPSVQFERSPDQPEDHLEDDWSWFRREMMFGKDEDEDDGEEDSQLGRRTSSHHSVVQMVLTGCPPEFDSLDVGDGSAVHAKEIMAKLDDLKGTLSSLFKSLQSKQQAMLRRVADIENKVPVVDGKEFGRMEISETLL